MLQSPGKNESRKAGVTQLLSRTIPLKRSGSLHESPQQTASPGALQSALDSGNVPAVRELLEHHFELVASNDFEWLRELRSLGYDDYEITELLFDDATALPWIFFDQPEPLENRIESSFHIQGCVHNGRHAVGKDHKMVTKDYEATEDIRRLIAEHCGLAGVVPVSRVPKDWLGSITFLGDDDSTALITYNTSESRCGLMTQLLQIVGRLCGVLTYLQNNRFCCSSFTLLHHINGEFGTIKMRKMKFDTVEIFHERLCLLSQDWDNRRFRERLSRSTSYAYKIIETVSENYCSRYNPDQDDSESYIDVCLHHISLAVQILTLGLLLYSQAHTGTVHPFFLMKSLHNCRLYGNRPPEQSIDAVGNFNNPYVELSLIRLTCLGEMIGDQVAVFNYVSGDQDRATKSYDLLALPEDVAETWDATRFLMDSTVLFAESVYAIEIGGGFIRCMQDCRTEQDRALLPSLHWSPGDSSLAVAKSSGESFNLRHWALIGITTVNAGCPLNEHQSWQEANVHMEELGTEDSYWEPSVVQIGIQAGQYAFASLNRTWVKRPGVTLKFLYLGPDISLTFLQSDWGLQISLCTGLARRVRVCEMLADVIPPFMDALLRKPTTWERLDSELHVVEALRGNDFGDWFQNLEFALKHDLERIIRHVLLILQDTGIDRSGKNLVAVWARKGSPRLCVKIPCEKANIWAKVLIDSTDCATFAYVTSLCLESSICKCRGQEMLSWPSSRMVLQTAVSRHVKRGSTTLTEAGTWALRDQKSYLIGKPESSLLGTVSITPALEAELFVSTSLIRASILSRIRAESRRKERLREKQFADARAQNVTIMAKV